jgi:hypothetical protein
VLVSASSQSALLSPEAALRPSSVRALTNSPKNRRTILREAEQHVGSKYVDQVLDSLYVIEMAMRHFCMRAEMGKNAGRKEALVDQDYKQAAALAALAALYRHARLSAMKLAGDPNNPSRIKDGGATSTAGWLGSD